MINEVIANRFLQLPSTIIIVQMMCEMVGRKAAITCLDLLEP